MKITSIFALCFASFLFLLSACKEDEPILAAVPTSIDLSNTEIYELLPAGTSVALLSTDVSDSAISYSLVSGEGDTDNAAFEVGMGLLVTKEILNAADGPMRSIRLSSTSPSGTYEQSISISVLSFDGDYPVVSSPLFEDGELMPQEVGADFENVSPELQLENIPANTVSMVLTMNDLDDNGSWHWAVWNIPPTETIFARNITWKDGVVEGDNDFGMGYTGPFPPSVHRYRISVYFLDTELDLEADKYTRLPKSMIGHIVAQSSLVGLFQP